VPLLQKVRLSHDTYLFRFGLPFASSVLGLPIGKHFKVFGKVPRRTVAGQWNGKEDPEAGVAEIERKYTPTSSDDDLGHVDLVIKVYRPGAHMAQACLQETLCGNLSEERV
jgi:cytochrome-b5 reductase